MSRMSTTPFQPAARDATAALRAPVLDQATIDFYLRRGRAERARAFSEMIRGIFSSPAPRTEARPCAEVHALPVRRQAQLPGDAERAA